MSNVDLKNLDLLNRDFPCLLRNKQSSGSSDSSSDSSGDSSIDSELENINPTSQAANISTQLSDNSEATKGPHQTLH